MFYRCLLILFGCLRPAGWPFANEASLHSAAAIPYKCGLAEQIRAMQRISRKKQQNQA